jgi:hypothetical protein
MSGRIILLISVFFLSFDQPKLVRTKISDTISVSIPKGWRPMDGMDFSERYPSVRAPIAAFTNEERAADFSVNISATQWPDADLTLAQKFFKAGIMNLFDRVEMISEGVREVNKRHYVYFEFESRVNGTRTQVGQQEPVIRYSYVQYLVEPRRTLVFSFNCLKRERPEWQPAAQAIMKSIKIK